MVLALTAAVPNHAACRLEQAQQLVLVLLLQVLAATPEPVGRPLSQQAAKLLGGRLARASAAAPAQPQGARPAAVPVRLAVVLNELCCSRRDMVTLAKLVLWCVQPNALMSVANVRLPQLSA